MLVFAGLTPFRNKKYSEALYIIGYFTVETVIDFSRLSESESEKCYKLYSNNAHLKRSYYTEDLVIAGGRKDKSKLLDKAILISQTKYDKIGRPYQAVSDEMENCLRYQALSKEVSLLDLLETRNILITSNTS